MAIIHDYFVDAINKSTMLRCHVVKDHYENLCSISPIVNFIDNRIDTILLLVENLRFWDAEMPYRSALEATAKLAKIILFNNENSQERFIAEFWEDLYEINLLKRAKKARAYMQLPIAEELKARFRNLQLSDAVFECLKEKWPKREQKKLENAWSFNTIINELSSNNVLPNRVSEILETISYNYKMSSHLIHGDETGIMIIRERELAPWGESREIDAAHMFRILSDSFFISATISLFTAIFVRDIEISDKIESLIKDVLFKMEKYKEEQSF